MIKTAVGVVRPGVVRPALIGALAGAGYGVALRAWMRLVSTDPEFTWGGTGYVVGAFTVLGAMAGLATAGRRRGWRRRLLGVRSAGIVLSLGCFVAAGAAMLPTIVPAALGRARRDWPVPLRAALVLLGAAAAAAVVLTLPGLPVGRRLLAFALYLPLCWVEVELTSRLYAPSLPRGSLRRPVRVAALACVVLLLGGVVVAMRGLPGSG